MQKQNNHIELLSPAGSFEALRAAIQAGCNAVYFGIEQLNMRARSSTNFSTKDLKEISAIATDNGIKTYITLNTILYDHDLTLMRKIVDVAQQNNISAIIAADHAVMNYARKAGMPVHISTQANITNIESVEFYAQFADVMVMARELTLEQVADIVKNIKRRNITGPQGQPVAVEVFGHGALCMAVSGKCYLSLHSDFASANRGACIQNCRRSYVVTDKETGTELEIENEYIMSAKDLCTIGFLDKILAAGISVLKIEGRGRSPDYVYTTTKCYREAIDALNQGSYTRQQIENWERQLATVYNRGFWDGYYLGRKMGEWSESYGSKATTKKIYLAKGVKYFDKPGAAEFLMEAHQLSVGDEIMIIGPTTGYLQTRVSELRVNNMPRTGVKQGELFSIPVGTKIRPSDKLYKVVHS